MGVNLCLMLPNFVPFRRQKFRKGGELIMKRIFIILLRIVLIASLFSPAYAQMERIYKFKKVQIPFNLKHEDSILKRGKYDLEFLKLESQRAYYLRIIKKGKFLFTILGEQLSYKTDKDGMAQLLDPNIPESPTLRMRKDPKDKILYIIFESGKKTSICPLIKVRFKLEYE
jgi:hypothetical protein